MTSGLRLLNLRLGFEQHFLFLIKLQIEQITGIARAFGIDMERKIFARRHPILIAFF